MPNSNTRWARRRNRRNDDRVDLRGLREDPGRVDRARLEHHVRSVEHDLSRGREVTEEPGARGAGHDAVARGEGAGGQQEREPGRQRQRDHVVAGCPGEILAHDVLFRVFYNYVDIRGGWEWDMPPDPEIWLESRSPKIARLDLKPMVLALAILLPMISRSPEAAWIPLSAVLKAMVFSR